MHVADEGIDMVPERNEQMTGTYVMLDARGRFFSNADGRSARAMPRLKHVYNVGALP